MASQSGTPPIEVPALPAKHDQFVEYVNSHKDQPLKQLLEPYIEYDAALRRIYAQEPTHPAAAVPNVVPIYAGKEQDITVRARDLASEDEQVRQCYIMPLRDEDRLESGTLAVAPSLKDFRTNFNLFSESALVDLDWSNVVAAGSAVVTSLLAVPKQHSSSKRALRDYYHEQLAPASDVDLFLYGLTEEQALEKVKQIEQNVRDAILAETTTVRTKNAITIASQYPTRHVQIVLRIYRSISEILTGFDVDCSCACYDGQQVYASPRALVAYMTQINSIDLTRRSPSYENRLSKYARRGFEVFWPNLDRSRIDPTIFERSFGRTEGLARLLILEKLPNNADRIAYLDQRRRERGRPVVMRYDMYTRRDNIKNEYEDEVAEWVDQEEVSNYNTFTIPYGPKYHARKIEKLLFTKDILLNSEWNAPKERKDIHLHRHPAFFGRAEDVFQDCCGHCPRPTSIEEEELAEEESKVYVSGTISFIKDDPGRQAIGSFKPITTDDWTEMAYIGNTQRLCQAIADEDVEYVRTWLEQDGNDPNTRDYTGRTPLHLAVTDSSVEVVQVLIDHGARIVARLFDGKTALHLAAIRGSVEIVSALMRKSEENEELESQKTAAKRAASKAEAKVENVTGLGHSRRSAVDQESDDGLDAESASAGATAATTNSDGPSAKSEDDGIDMMDDAHDDDDLDATTENSIVNLKPAPAQADDRALVADESEDEADVYDINVVAWDTAVSPLHLAIVNGHIDVVKCLVQDFGADVLLPIKLYNDYDKSARAAILVLVLALRLPLDMARSMANTLIDLGASIAQADLNSDTVLRFAVAYAPHLLPTLSESDRSGYRRAVNYVSDAGRSTYSSPTNPLITAIRAKDADTALLLLSHGAKAVMDMASAVRNRPAPVWYGSDAEQNKKQFEKLVEQPVIVAASEELPQIVMALILDHNADVNTLSSDGYNVLHDEWTRNWRKGQTLLDIVKEKIETMESWKLPENPKDEPLAPGSDDEYLKDLKDGTYAMWNARQQLKNARESYKIAKDAFDKDVTALDARKGVVEQQAAVSSLVEEYKNLLKILEDRGAKTFADLHPGIGMQDARGGTRWNNPASKSEPFKLSTNFSVSDSLDDTRDKYISLFEAAWTGDVPLVEALTMQGWKDTEGETRPPLTAAVKDSLGISPFALAIYRGHLELAARLLETIQAQYVPPSTDRSKHLKIDNGDEEDDYSEYDSDDEQPKDADAPRVRAHFSDEKFTHETVGEVSLLVNCPTTPVEVLGWGLPSSVDLVRDGALKGLSPEKVADVGAARSIVQLALYNDDLKLLSFLLDLGDKFTKAAIKEGEDGKKQFYSVSDDDYMTAIKVDRPHLVAELIKATGSGLPIRQLLKRSGTEFKEESKYYQGLSVYGKKRKDWAAAATNQAVSEPVEDHRPPLLQSASWGSLETFEWFLTDAPIRCYKQFAENNMTDKRIQHLIQADGGLEASLDRFLKVRPQLAIHCSIMGAPCPEQTKLLEYLVKNNKAGIDAKSAGGTTPLHIAYRLYREDAAKLLIGAGADQAARDKDGSNILHHLLSSAVQTQREVEQVTAMLDLIDKRLLPSLFVERTSTSDGSLAPIAAWVQNATRPTTKQGDVVLKLLLSRCADGGVEELNMVNGEGHTPLHHVASEKHEALAKTILAADPTLLLRENATGRTPLEATADARIMPLVTQPLELPPSYGFTARVADLRGLAGDWSSPLRNRVASGFDPAVIAENKKKATAPDGLWELFTRTHEQLEREGRAKRRLVTLNEANEVARRLTNGDRRVAGRRGWRHATADQVRGHGEHQVEVEVEVEPLDEVQVWLPSATKSK